MHRVDNTVWAPSFYFRQVLLAVFITNSVFLAILSFDTSYLRMR